jgi:DNA-binding response OmpR family regulator
MRILFADDDRDIAEYVRRELADEGHTARVCHDGGEAWRLARRETFDLILLDVMMPVMDGVEVTRRLRLDRHRTPIILLTARDAAEDIVRGLDAGADDYLTKPFSFDVLLARIRARTREAPGNALQRFNDLALDPATREVWRGRRSIALTRTEFALLETLLRAAGRVVSRDHLIAEVWSDREVTENNLEVFVRGLRAKVDAEGEPRLIHTERGIGYRLRHAGS